MERLKLKQNAVTIVTMQCLLVRSVCLRVAMATKQTTLLSFNVFHSLSCRCACVFLYTLEHTQTMALNANLPFLSYEKPWACGVCVSRLNVQMWSNNGSCVYAKLSQLHTQSQSHWNGSVETKPNKPSIIISALPQNCLLGNSLLYICLNFVWIYFFRVKLNQFRKKVFRLNNENARI